MTAPVSFGFSLVLGWLFSSISHAASETPAIFDGERWRTLTQISSPPQVLDDSNSILMVSLASYRDGIRCGRTLFSMFSEAKFPSRLRVGIVQQNHVDDKDCQEEFCRLVSASGARGQRCAGWDRQLFVRQMKHTDARGPVYARALGHQLRPHEADSGFCLQMDSHMLVSRHWDVELINMWSMTNNDRAVLTTYVPRLEDLGVNINNRNEVPVICQMTFKDGMPRNFPATVAIHLTEPKLSTLWAAGFSFSKCHAELLVPYDPQLPQIFDGEEFSRAARLWTHGYDFYAPHRSVVAHNYSTELGWDKQLGWPRIKSEEAQSRSRIFTLLRLPGGNPSLESSLGKFGLGSKRSLEAYERFLGVSLAHQQVLDTSDSAQGCKDLVKVPLDVASPLQKSAKETTAFAEKGLGGRKKNPRPSPCIEEKLIESGGIGGFTDQCHFEGSLSQLSDCEKLMLTKQCGALTFKHQTCFLHDTTEASDFRVEVVANSIVMFQSCESQSGPRSWDRSANSQGSLDQSIKTDPPTTFSFGAQLFFTFSFGAQLFFTFVAVALPYLLLLYRPFPLIHPPPSPHQSHDEPMV